MYMSDGDIITSFRQAKDQKNQISVLADLNACTRSEMREKLAELGLIDRKGPGTLKSKKPGPKPKLMDELRAMELYNDGMTDLDIAECLGESEYRVAKWRRMMRLKPNVKEVTMPEIADDIQDPAAGIVEEAEQMPECRDSEYEEQRMSAWALLEILQRLTSAYPDREVSIRTEGGAGILRAAIKVEYGAEAEIASVGG